MLLISRCFYLMNKIKLQNMNRIKTKYNALSKNEKIVVSHLKSNGQLDWKKELNKKENTLPRSNL